MATLKEVESAVNIIRRTWENIGYNQDCLEIGDKKLEQLTVLHCNTAYPTPLEDVNLLAMDTMRDKLNVSVGYSDHTLGIDVSLAAVSRGATVIEKHFTLDRKMDGPDHAASLEPNELKRLIEGIRNINLAMGDGKKRPSKSEEPNIKIARKSLHFSKKLEAGHIVEKGDLTAKRPGDGIPPYQISMILGKALSQKVDKDQKVNKDLFN